MEHKASHEKIDQVEAIYQTHKIFLRNLANRYIQDTDLANDIVHDCILQLLDKSEQYNLEDPLAVRGLVAKIVIGLSKDALRKKKKEILCEHDEIERRQEPFLLVTDDRSEYYLSKLQPEDAYLLRKVILEGYAIKEIAQERMIPEATMRKRYQRAKERIAAIVLDEVEREGR